MNDIERSLQTGSVWMVPLNWIASPSARNDIELEGQVPGEPAGTTILLFRRGAS